MTGQTDDALAFINHSLATLGFSALHSISAETENVMLAFINAFQSKLQYCNDLEARMARINSDYESLYALNDRLKQKCETLTSQSFDSRVKAEQLEATLVDTLKDNQALKDELKTTKSSLAYCKNQQVHDMRKRERESEKMKVTLQKYSMDGMKSAKIAYKIINPSNSVVSRARKQSELDDDSSLYQEALITAQEREKMLIEENLLLRQACYDAYITIESFLSKAIEPMIKKRSSSDKQKPRFFMPYDTVSNQIEHVLRESVDYLGERVSRFEKLVGESEKTEDEVRIYKQQIDECRKVIQEQQKLLEMSLSSELRSEKQRGGVVDEKAETEIREEKDRLLKLRKQLDDERKQFTEAAIRLGRERAVFEKEKEMLEEEKRNIETQNVLKDLPTTPSWLRKSIQKIHETTPGQKNDFSPFNAQVSRISIAPSVTPSFAKTRNNDVNASPMEDLDKYLQPTDLDKTPAPPKSIAARKGGVRFQDENMRYN